MITRQHERDAQTDAFRRDASLGVDLSIEIELDYEGFVLEGGREAELVDGHAGLFVGLVQDRDVSRVAIWRLLGFR